MKQYLFSMLLVVLIGCHSSGINDLQPIEQLTRQELTSIEKAVVSSDNSFGLKLFARINESEQDKNVFISPFSVSMALGMALNGASGATLDSIKKVLEHSNFTLEEINESYKNISYILTHLDPKVVFKIANSIWCRKGFPVHDTFLNDCKYYFDAGVESLDFASPDAVQTINKWVNTKTNGKINKILEKIKRETMMYLINAIYFKGIWSYQFDPSKTQNDNFTTSTGSIVTCQMMLQDATFAYKETDEAQIIDLPYGDRLFSMTIILPKAGIDINQYAVGFTQQKWTELIGALDSTGVKLFVPKFKLEYEKNLNNELIAMGMGIAFSEFADFSRISSLPLMISEVKHKTFVEVNEEGTEAAAVTAVGIGITSVPVTPIVRIDRPFIFVIREHKSGTILFIGKIVNPST